MGDPTLLDRPAVSPQQPATGSGQADGNPSSNARGQYRYALLAPAAAARIAQLDAEIAAAETAAAAAEATAAAAGTTEALAAPEEAGVPVVGWIIGGVAILGVGGLAAYAAHKRAQANAAKEKAAQEKRKLEEDEKLADSGGGGDKTNVKVTGDPCETQPYNKNKCAEGQDAHHIIMDMIFRYGTRGSAGRIPNAPSLESGDTICLSKAEHKEVHDLMRESFKGLGNDLSNGPKGTAPIKDIVDKSIEALEKVKPECKGEFEHIRDSFKDMEDQLGRTSQRPPAAGSPAEGGMRGAPKPSR